MKPGLLLTFRILAYTTGVWLILLLLAMVNKYVFDGDSTLTRVVATAHGWIYFAYVISAFMVAQRLRWSAWRTVGLLLAGTIPFMSFVAERKVMAAVHQTSQATGASSSAGA